MSATRSRYWFVEIHKADVVYYTVSPNPHDAVIRVMCCLLDVEYDDNSYSYIVLCDAFYAHTGEARPQTTSPYDPYYILQTMQDIGILKLTPERVVTTRIAEKSILAFKVHKVDRVLYSMGLVGIFDILMKVLFPTARPSDAVFVRHLSALSGRDLAGLSKADIVDKLLESGYISLEEDK